ncbi:MAG: S8 family serine peptidase [Bacteriovoracaceae bacterium]|nr:S8 family serine peptidase [Bacteriovoracaceae bacterium]
MSLFRIALSSLLISQAYAADVIVKAQNTKALSLAGFEIKEALIPSLGIYLVRDQQKSIAASISKARSLAGVDGVMANSVMQLRAITPNDASWSQQWGPKIIGAQQAWELGTGGHNSDHDDVVVAVVDNGSDINHEDLKANIWVNAGEIPGNGKDDDGNGKIDDVNGWNAYNNNAEIPVGMHGTHVSGIVGAEGNNGKYTTGVNWDVKIMPVAASSGETAVVLKGYNYVLEQKKLWLSTGGRKGANVVSTNSSFGVDAAKCTDAEYKVWNDIYEAMGQVGILSAAATANQAWDIDATGDVPTSCESDFIIAVTNTDKNDNLYRQAGWGKTHVDIGAPGTDVFSTVPGNQARNLTGTSMATPHIAGAVGFLYSVASPAFTALAKSQPAKAAKELKKIMMNTVDPLNDLKGKTVSGGRLNLAKAAQAISKY